MAYGKQGLGVEGGSGVFRFDEFDVPEMRLRDYTRAGFLESLRCQSVEFGDAPAGIRFQQRFLSREIACLDVFFCFCFFSPGRMWTVIYRRKEWK